METITLTGVDRTNQRTRPIRIEIDTQKLPDNFMPLSQNKRSFKQHLCQTIQQIHSYEYINTVDHHFNFSIQSGLTTGKLQLEY